MRLIDADEAYKVLTDYYHHKTEIQHKALKEAIERVPTVDAEPVKHGMWINISISANGNESSAECDLCGARVYNNFSSVINYCPNCGAKMGEDRDYEHAVEQLEHNMTFEPTYNSEDGSM